MKNLSWFVLVVSIAVIVSSCAKSDDSKTASTDNTSSSDDSSGDSSTTTELEGTWVVSCFDDGGGNYLIKTLTVTGTDFVDKVEIYSDSNCATNKDKWEYTYTSLSIGQEMTFSTYSSSG